MLRELATFEVERSVTFKCVCRVAWQCVHREDVPEHAMFSGLCKSKATCQPKTALLA